MKSLILKNGLFFANSGIQFLSQTIAL